MELFTTITCPLSILQRQRVMEIDNTDFGRIRKKTAEMLAKEGRQVDDKYLDEGILALKQYYAVALLDPTNEHAVSDEIDPFWHAHILHTSHYIDFCDRVYGHYIPHEPLDHDDVVAVAEIRELYNYTRGMYEQMFGYINETFFPKGLVDARLVCRHMEVRSPDVRKESRFPLRSAA